MHTSLATFDVSMVINVGVATFYKTVFFTLLVMKMVT